MRVGIRRDPRFLASLIISLITAVCFSFAPALSQQIPSAQDVTGTWLVEPANYDMWADRGVEIAAYPVLRIHSDKRFALYRLMSSCFPVKPDGSRYKLPDEDLEHDAACEKALAISEKDGFRIAYAFVSASGTWQIEPDSRLKFVSTFQGTTSQEWKDTLADIVRLGAMNPAAAPRYATFYTTFYVLDGAPLTVERRDSLLSLTDPDRRTLSFRAVRPEVVDLAVAVIRSAGVVTAPYFRCLLSRLDKDVPASGAPGTELGKFAIQAREDEVLMTRFRHVATRIDANKATAADRHWMDANVENFKAAHERHRNHPIRLAANDRKLGTYLGCPERDQIVP